VSPWIIAAVSLILILMLAVANRFGRDFRALVVVLVFLPISAGILWLAKIELGISEGPTQVALLIMVLLLYGVASGRVTEFTGPGGWGAKFREVAASAIDASPSVDLSTGMQHIRKQNLNEMERRIHSITPDKPVVVSLTVRPGGEYQVFDLHSVLQALTRFPNFKFVLFLTSDGTIVSYMPAQTLLGLLSADQIGVAHLAGSGNDLVQTVNHGDVARVRGYTGMVTKTISLRTSNEKALDRCGGEWSSSRGRGAGAYIEPHACRPRKGNEKLKQRISSRRRCP
jgi:hypothetical protein